MKLDAVEELDEALRPGRVRKWKDLRRRLPWWRRVRAALRTKLILWRMSAE